ncbi:MAG: hypothetical protein P8N02_00825, partial [Actinomycetota bacterium]|nr:hypothetical protein [Actinomycetota bacterium]
TPTEVGTIEYVCTLHPQMVATVEVVPAAAVASSQGNPEVGSATALLAANSEDSWKGPAAAAAALLSASILLALLFGLLRGIERRNGRLSPEPQ